MHKVITALQHTWHLLCDNKVLASQDTTQRILAIVEQLHQLSTNKQITDCLAQLQQQLKQAHLQQLLIPLGVKPSPKSTPWLQTTPSSPLPASLETLGPVWRDEISHSKELPYERLALALQMLPYSTAFNEAAIALRAILRDNSANTDASLQLLYVLAAIHSFIALEPETPSGDKVATAISGADMLALTIDYSKLGTEALPLLNITDKSLIEKNWGPATKHQRLSDMYPETWLTYTKKLEINP